ncbi:MAG: hypothetical protein ACQESG_01550, partial [Nanobdellota archaeon]
RDLRIKKGTIPLDFRIHNVRHNSRFLSRYMILESFEELDNELTIINRYDNPKRKKNPRTNKIDTYKDHQALIVTQKGRVMEFQFKDRWTHLDNEKGCLNHEDYVKKQQRDLEKYPELMMFCQALSTGKPDSQLLQLFRASRFRKRYDSYIESLQQCSVPNLVKETEEIISLYQQLERPSGELMEESMNELESMLIDIPLNFINKRITDGTDYLRKGLILNQILSSHGISSWNEDVLVEYALSEESEYLKEVIAHSSFRDIHRELINRLFHFTQNLETYATDEILEQRIMDLDTIPINYAMSTIMRLQESPLSVVLPEFLDQGSTLYQAIDLLEETRKDYALAYNTEELKNELITAVQHKVGMRITEAFQACAHCTRQEGVYRSMVGFSLYKDLQHVEESLPEDAPRLTQDIHETSFYFDSEHLTYLPKGILFSDIPSSKQTNMGLLRRVSDHFVGEASYATRVKETMKDIRRYR